MNEITPPNSPTPQPDSFAAICPKLKRDAIIHCIFAALLAVFVAVGYIPSNERPKFDAIERKEVAAEASADTRAAVDKENKEIEKKNTEGAKVAEKEARQWEKSGRASMASLLMFSRFLAAFLASLWVVFCVCSYLIKPLLTFLKDFLGEDIAKIITPMVMLGVAYVLSTIVMQNSAVKDIGGSGLVVAAIMFVNHIVRPFLGAITDFTEFVVKNWTVGLVYLAIVIYAIVRKFVRPLP